MPERPLRALSSEEIAAYEREGVICARGLFPPHWVERMAKAVDRVVAAPTFMGNVVSIPEKKFSGDLFLWKTDDDFLDFVYESPASRIAQQVMSSKRVNFFYDQLFVKPPGCHVPTPWHHDVTYAPRAGSRASRPATRHQGRPGSRLTAENVTSWGAGGRRVDICTTERRVSL